MPEESRAVEDGEGGEVADNVEEGETDEGEDVEEDLGVS